MKAKIKVIWKDFVHYLKKRDYQWKFKLIVILPLFFTLLFIDVLSKNLVNKYLEFDKELSFMPGFINIQLVYNKGSAFGFNADNPTLVIASSITLSFFILLALIFLNQKPLLVGLTMMFTGALGNLIDRTWTGKGVIDFFAWKLFLQSIFNFADVWVVFGLVEVVCVIVYSLIKDFVLDRKEIKKEDSKQEKISNKDNISKDKDSSDEQNEAN